MKSFSLLFIALLVAFSLSAQDEKKSEIQVKIIKDGKTVKDTIYIFKLLVDKANVKILEISRHNISKKEFYFKITIQNIYEMNNDNFF